MVLQGKVARNPILTVSGGTGTGKTTAGSLAMSLRGTDGEMMNGATPAALRKALQAAIGGLQTINDWHLAVITVRNKFLSRNSSSSFFSTCNSNGSMPSGPARCWP
jgi:hypothetical protein